MGQVFIHAGAHRTGTSSFQMCLAENRSALEAAGFDLAYPGRDGVPRGALALRLPGPRAGAEARAGFEARARAHLAALSPDPGRALLLSEENIPGRMFHFYAGQFYPAAAARLAIVKAALPGPVAHLVHVIRPYHALFVSAYRKRSEDNAVAPFSEIAPRMAAFAGGWPELLEQMRTILRPERMSVIAYPRRGESRALLARLIGGPAARFAEPARALNVSATDAALIALQERYRAGERLGRAAWRSVIAAHAAETDDRGYAAFRPGQRARLARRYRRDLERIAALDGVDLIA